MPTLQDTLETLESIAPLRLAADWDNVGLLLEGTRDVSRIFLTIDLTQAVVEEALEAEADLVLAYHPPIFGGLKRLTTRNASGLLRLIRSGIHVYSPHTALDAAADGMGDWLLDTFEVSERAPVTPDAIDPAVGIGRVGTLTRTLSSREAIARTKAHLGLSHVRVAAGTRPIRRVAVCPGAGHSVLSDARDVDLVLTGEMRHHDVLAWTRRGVTVILTDHTNTERGFLPLLADRLAYETVVSRVDADPLAVR